MKYFIPLFIFLASCVAQTVLTTQEISQIPAKSKFIDCDTGIPADSLYRIVYRDLLKTGCQITEHDQELKYILAEQNLEQDTRGRYTIYMEGERMTLTCEWTAGAMTQVGVSIGAGVGLNIGYSPAVWEGPRNRAAVVFSHGVKFAQKYGPVSYRK